MWLAELRALKKVNCMKRQEPFKELISRCKLVSAEHKDFQVVVKEVYKMQNSTSPDIMNDISRRGSMLYDIRNPPVFETRSKKTVRHS